MDTAKHFRHSRLFAAAVLASLLLLPRVGSALSIGEIVLQSSWGGPLQAKVNLNAGAGEHIEDACLSLVEPDTHEDDILDYLTKAKLAVKTEGGQQYVVISSHKPFNELFAKLRLQIKCPGMGAITKTLTILPDLDTSPIAAPVAAGGILPEAANATTSSAPGSGETPNEINSSTAPAGSRNALQKRMQPGQGGAGDTKAPRHPKLAENKAAQPARKRTSAIRSSRKGRQEAPLFKLKLSGDPIDVSQIGKISAEERELLLAKQKLLDADDQTAHFLAMQHQMKQLQDEIGEVRLRLAQLSASSPIAAPPVADTQANRPQPPVKKPSIASQQQTAEKGGPALRYSLITLGLVLFMLALLLGLRRYSGIKANRAAGPIPEEEESTPLDTLVTPAHIFNPSAPPLRPE